VRKQLRCQPRQVSLPGVPFQRPKILKSSTLASHRRAPENWQELSRKLRSPCLASRRPVLPCTILCLSHCCAVAAAHRSAAPLLCYAIALLLHCHVSSSSLPSPLDSVPRGSVQCLHGDHRRLLIGRLGRRYCATAAILLHRGPGGFLSAGAMASGKGGGGARRGR